MTIRRQALAEPHSSQGAESTVEPAADADAKKSPAGANLRGFLQPAWLKDQPTCIRSSE
jgi:hypothetical protein